MVLGILGAIAGATAIPMSAVAIPMSASSTSTSVIGLSQGMNNQQAAGQQQTAEGGGGGQDLANDPRLAKFTLKTYVEPKSSFRNQVHKKQVVLRNGRLYLDEMDSSRRRYQDGHAFAGFYLEYPIGDPKPLALVSTIKPDPPELNWIYVDRRTMEFKYGNKTQSSPHIYAPWDWTEDREALTLEGWEGFVAVQEDDGWVLCYDRNDDHLRNIRGRRRVVEVTLERELLAPPPSPN